MSFEWMFPPWVGIGCCKSKGEMAMSDRCKYSSNKSPGNIYSYLFAASSFRHRDFIICYKSG